MDIDLQEIYDGFAETYEENRGLFDMSEILLAFDRSLGREQGALLDMGCGAGEPFSKYFVERGWEVTGVDLSEQMLAMAAKFVPEMQRIHADMRDVTFTENQFDAVTAVYSLFHLPRDEHAAIFSKVHDWLKPGGKFLFTYATQEYTGSEAFDGYKEFMGQRLYYSHKTPQQLEEDVRALGFNLAAKDYRDIGGETFLWLTLEKAS